MNRIKEFFEDILDELRNISYNHSEERREFASLRLKHHREYMKGFTKINPYLHEEEWNEHH
jgi:hypothetical protein